MSKRVEKTKKNLMGSLWRKAVSDARVSKKSVNAADDDTKENASTNPVASSAAKAGDRRDQTSKSSSDCDGVLKHKLPKKLTIEQTIDEEVAKLSMEMAKTHSSEAAQEQQQSSGNSHNKEKPWPVMTSNAPGLANCSSLPVQSKTIAPSPSFRIPQAASMITKSSRSSIVSKASAALRSPRTPKRSVKALVEKEKSAPLPVMKSGESQALGTSASLPVQSKSIQSRQIPQVSSMVAKSSKSSNNTNAAPRPKTSARRGMSTSIVSKSSKDTSSVVSKSKISDVKTTEPKKVISPINNRYHAEKAIQKEEAASAASAAAEVASAKTKAISRKKRQEQKKSALQQFREEEAAKAKEQARIKADIQMAATKRREEDIKNGRGCLMDGLVCRPQLSLVSEDPENKVLTPRRSNATPMYAKGEKDEEFEVNADKGETKLAKGKSESDLAIESNKSMGKKPGAKYSVIDVIYTHELPSKNKAQESDTDVPSTSSKPLKTKIKAVPKANATPINKSQSENIVPDANGNLSNEKPKMSPRSKARMKRHNLASNSLTEKDVDEFPDSTAFPKYACFGSQAIIPDADSEESDMVGDEIVREASEAIGKALNIDPNEVKINIDRVVEDVAVSPKGLFGIKKWFDRGESERSNIMPNDSIFDGLESVAPIKSKKQSRGICSSALANLVCGTGEQVIVENEEGELRIRNIASVCTDDGEVIEVDEVLANDTLDYESDTDIGDETFDIDSDLEEDVAELGFDVYTPVKERMSESFEEDCSHYTEESDLDGIITEDECSVQSETDFDSVSAITSSSASESLEGSDDELSEMISTDSRRSPHSKRHIPERICPTPIAVQSPISVNEASTCDESTRSAEKGRKTPLVRLTPSFSSFFKKTGLSTPRSNKTKLLASNYTPESEGLEDQKKSNFNTDMTSKIPTQVMCAVSVPEKAVKEDNKPIETAASLRSETSNGKVDDEPVAKICDDNETDLAADSMCETESKDEPQLSSTSGEAFTLNDVQRTHSTLSKASVKENHTATTLEESSTDNTGSAITEEISNESVITEQISSEANGIEVSFSSNSEKEQSDVLSQQEITSTPQTPVQEQQKQQSVAEEIEPHHEIGHEVEIEENVVTCISSAVYQDTNSVKSNDNGEEFDKGEGKDTPVDSNLEAASHDQDSIESQKESRQDSFLPEVAADDCREGTDSAERVTDSESKQEEQQNIETEPALKSSSTLDKDKTFSSKTSLDRSTSASSRVSDVLSSTSEGIEIKTPIKGIGHKRRKSRVRSFLMDKIQKPACIQSE